MCRSPSESRGPSVTHRAVGHLRRKSEWRLCVQQLAEAQHRLKGPGARHLPSVISTWPVA